MQATLSARSDHEFVFPDTASDGGSSTSGDAIGGGAGYKRAYDADTAGGYAKTGDSSDVNGGTVANYADSDGTITNTDSCKSSHFHMNRQINVFVRSLRWYRR